jgi:hypothetical protein
MPRPLEDFLKCSTYRTEKTFKEYAEKFWRTSSNVVGLRSGG